MQEFTIGKNEAGQRLDKYLGRILKEAPVSFFYKMMRKKNIVLNGTKCTGREQLSVGDSVKLFLSDETIEKFSGTQKVSKISKIYPYKKLDIIYEDDDVLFVNKPSGMLTQKASPADVSLNEYIIGYLLHEGKINEAQLRTFKPSVCNRLDRNTSGLVLAGKSMKGSRELSEIIKNRTLEKYYITVVKGKVTDDSSVCALLIKDEAANKVSVRPIDGSMAPTEDERFIRTDYHVLGHGEDYTVLEVHLITGRPHQIRAHLAMLGHPILGDFKYGDRKINEKYKLKDQLLHAYRVVLPDGREYKAPVPAKLEKFTKNIFSLYFTEYTCFYIFALPEQHYYRSEVFSWPHGTQGGLEAPSLRSL